MPFDSFYLSPRKVIVHPYTGETIICEQCTRRDHACAPRYTQHGEFCEFCDDYVSECSECERCVSCCRCGNYHSVDCPWPL